MSPPMNMANPSVATPICAMLMASWLIEVKSISIVLKLGRLMDIPRSIMNIPARARMLSVMNPMADLGFFLPL